MAVGLVGSAGGLATAAGASVTPAFGQATTAGSLLICCAISGTNTSFTITGPSGWVNANAVGQLGNRAEIWYKPNCAAGETAPTVNCTLASVMAAQVSSWAGVAPVSPLDTSGTATAAAVSSLTVTTAGNVSGGGGGLGVTVFGDLASVGTGVWTPGVGWVNLANDFGSAIALHFASDYLLNPPTQATLSENGGDTTPAQISWCAVIATFLPADVPIIYGRGAN